MVPEDVLVSILEAGELTPHDIYDMSCNWDRHFDDAQLSLIYGANTHVDADEAECVGLLHEAEWLN